MARKRLTRNTRLVRFVGAMKRGEYPNALSMARGLRRSVAPAQAVCSRTLQRDIDYLRLRLDAPIEYDPVHHGYHLTDPDWAFPLEELRGDLLYACLLGEALSAALIPWPLRSSLEEAMHAQLTAADPDEIEPELLRAVVFATGAAPHVEAAVFETVHQAWRNRHGLRIEYEGTKDSDGQAREVDVHALFLAQGAWYARVHCHLRKAPRSLALHRIRAPELLTRRFRRDSALLAAVRRGNVFDYETVRHVVVECSVEKARLMAEREWFPGQKNKPLPDGRLRLTFPKAPRPELLFWILSYCGHLAVRSPQDLVDEVRRAGERIVREHGAAEVSRNRDNQRSPT